MDKNIKRIKQLAADVRAQRLRDREDQEEISPGEHPLSGDLGVTVRPSELSLLVTPYHGQR